jgi:hypothetical protein
MPLAVHMWCRICFRLGEADLPVLGRKLLRVVGGSPGVATVVDQVGAGCYCPSRLRRRLHFSARLSAGRFGGFGWCALALMVMYLAVPGVNLVHVAVAHDGGCQTAHAAACDVHHHELDHHGSGDAPEQETLGCGVCQLLGTLNPGVQPLTPSLPIGVGVVLPENAAVPQVVCLPDELRRRPSAPRAPPMA